MDTLTYQRIKTLHPSIRKQVEEMYTYANNKLLGKGVRLRFTHTLRTIEEQDALYAQGRTKPGSIVTNAKGGSSMHNYGLAWDVVILYDKDGDGTFETASWDTKDPNFLKVVKYFKENKSVTWGGDFKSFKDAPHFEMNFGLTPTKLKVGQKDRITESIEGKLYVYPKL